MNAFILLIPLLFIRYVLLFLLDRGALKRAAYFPPLAGWEKPAYWAYQLATAAIFVYPFFLKVSAGSLLFAIGLAVYAVGTVLFAVSAVHFAKPGSDGMNRNGIYRFSRNPMYVSYFLYFLGCVLLTQSWILLIPVLVFQVSGHWIILSEERWCLKAFGDSYAGYMRTVGRYI